MARGAKCVRKLLGAGQTWKCSGRVQRDGDGHEMCCERLCLTEGEQQL